MINKYQSRIGSKIIKLVVLFAIVTTVIISLGQLYFSYQQGIQNIKTVHRLIKIEYSDALSHNIWVMDLEQLNIQLSALLEKKEISHVAIHANNELLAEKFKEHESDSITSKIHLYHTHRGEKLNIGTLVINSGTDELHQDLINQLNSFFLFNALEYFLLVLFFIFVFHRLVAVQLYDFVRYIETQDENLPFIPFQFKNASQKQTSKHELHDVVDAYNLVCGRLYQSLKKLKEKEAALLEHQNHLQKLVDNRTLELRGEIVEREKSESALQKREQDLQTILKTMNEGFWQIDAEANTVMVNQTMGQILGRSPEELIGCNVSQFYDDENLVLLNAELAKRRHGELGSYEISVSHKNGQQIPCQFNATPMYDSVGQFLGSFATVMDITEKKEAERALEDQRNYLNNVLESLSHPFFVINASDFSVVLANSAAIDAGVRVEGKCFSLTHDRETPCDGINHLCPLEEVKRTKKPTIVEHIHYDRTGRKINVEIHGFPIFNEKGDVIQMIEYSQDITLRKKIEQNLIDSKLEAESANQAKSEFLANMSHELRTPLNGIIGFTQVLERQLKGKVEGNQLEYFIHIKDSGQHLLEMVNDILDLSKIEAGKVEIDSKPFDLKGMLERAPDIIKSEAFQKKLNVKVSIDPNIGWVIGDEKRLKQVVYNLLSNAVKFTNPGKSIGIEGKIVEGAIEIIVWDKGIGIPTSHLSRIFSPFEQVKNYKQSRESGTGLGLAISNRLIGLHHGNLSVESKVGEGSRFTIKLPETLKVGSPLETDRSENQTSAFSPFLLGKDILVTEDKESNRILIEAVLESTGCHLDFALNGEEALMKASKQGYHLILMDIQLPGMDGITTMKEIRKVIKKETPILALTAFAMDGDEKKLLAEGFDNYVSKPINIDRFLNTLFQTLQKKEI